jgi:hypothetical protein
MIAISAMPLHTREKVVNGVNQIIAFCGYSFFLVGKQLLSTLVQNVNSMIM